jgi:hypothetical protein
MKPIPLASLLVLQLVFSGVHCFSQTTFLPGYIVKNGDTLRGNLKIDRQKDLAHQVSFRQDGKAEFRVFTPSDLTAFRYDDGSLYRAISYVNTLVDASVTETVFAHALVSGMYSLYSVNADGFMYYVVKKDTSTWFLYNDRISGMDVVHGNFRNLLLLFSVGCGGVDANNVAYTEKDMATYLLRINQCQGTGDAGRSYYVKPRKEVHYFIYAGGLPGGNNYQATLDAAVRFVNPELDPKVSLNIGLHYSNTGNYAPEPVVVYTLAGGYVVETENVKATHQVFSIPATLQYNFLRGKVQPAIYLGFSALYRAENPPNPNTDQRVGVTVLAGACIEAYPGPHFLIKADWRYELLVQHPSIGIGYTF